MYHVREAMLGDIDELCTHLEHFSDCYSTKLPPYKDKQTSEKILKNMIENHVFYVAVTDNYEKIVGFIAGFVCDHIYNPDIKTLAEAFWYVEPEARKSGIGMQLLETYESWGKNNVDWVLMTIEEDTPIDERVFLSRGFKRKEVSYILEVE